MENILPALQRWFWALTLTAVILAPSFRETDYKSYAASIGFLLLLLTQAFRLFKKPEISFSPLELYLALYVGWTCLSYFWSPVGLAASEYLGRFLPCVGLFLLVRQDGLIEKPDLRFWLAGMIVAMLLGLAQGLRFDFIPAYFQEENGRIFSTFGNPNVYAAFLVLSFPILCLGFFPKNDARSTVMTGFVIIVLFLSLYLAQSRAGFVGLLAEFCLLVFWAWPRIARFQYGKWAVLFLSAVVLCFLYEKITAFAFRPTERLEVWKGTIQMMLDKPVQGWGIGQFSLHFQPYMTEELSVQVLRDNSFAEHAHNEVLELGVELGLVGWVLAGLFWFRLLGRAVLQSLKLRKEEGPLPIGTMGLTAGLLGLGITNLFDYNCRLSGIAFLLWLSAGLLANRVFPSDKIKLKAPTGAVLCFLLAGSVIFGLVEETRLLTAVLTENSQRDFLKEIPSDLSLEQQKLLEDIKIRPNNPDNYHELGNLFAKAGRLDQAQIAFEKELELNPRSEGAFLNLGNIFLLTADKDPGRLELAKACYERCIQLDPQKMDGHFDLAYVYFLHKDMKGALGQLNEVLKMDPQNAKALALKRQILP